MLSPRWQPNTQLKSGTFSSDLQPMTPNPENTTYQADHSILVVPDVHQQVELMEKISC